MLFPSLLVGGLTADDLACLIIPLPLEVLDRFWSAMAEEAGPNLLRVKGLVHVRENPIHRRRPARVQEVLDDKRWLPAWPSDDRRTRLVFTGWIIDEERVNRLWEDTVCDC